MCIWFCLSICRSVCLSIYLSIYLYLDGFAGPRQWTPSPGLAHLGRGAWKKGRGSESQEKGFRVWFSSRYGSSQK